MTISIIALLNYQKIEHKLTCWSRFWRKFFSLFLSILWGKKKFSTWLLVSHLILGFYRWILGFYQWKTCAGVLINEGKRWKRSIPHLPFPRELRKCGSDRWGYATTMSLNLSLNLFQKYNYCIWAQIAIREKNLIRKVTEIKIRCIEICIFLLHKLKKN